MGEVYRARDERLERDVALKVLPASKEGPEQALRLEREARVVGSLNHPNVLAVFDVGEAGGRPYIVTELLEGETLRERLRSDRLAPRRILEYAVQIAEGLAAAHDRGIYHRDIKPENLFLTRDGLVKILDFGLAKRVFPPLVDDTATGPLGSEHSTESGTVLGTVGYMAPEQVTGAVADHRSDIFSFGAVLYEMATGRRAFRRPSPVETMNAVLHENPPDLTIGDTPAATGLSHVIARCLEKKPEDRFQSARDLTFQLKELQGNWATTRPGRRLPLGRRGGRALLLGSAALAVLAAGSWLVGRELAAPTPRFTQLTFHRGTVFSARFASTDESLLYSAAWDGRPSDVYLVLPHNPEARTLGYPGGRVLAVSSAGEMALMLRPTYAGGENYVGTLARAPLGGGAAREVLEQVEDADWSPDGSTLAAVRSAGVGDTSRLEYPPGTVLHRSGSIRSPRVSPDGRTVAFIDDPSGYGYGGTVTVVGRDGRARALAGPWGGVRGLAWAPGGGEVWFTAAEEGSQRTLRAVSLSGRQRTLMVAPTHLALQDVTRGGRVLLASEVDRRGLIALAPGAEHERELSWFDATGVGDISADGRTVLFGDRFGVYVRGTDGSPAVRLGRGFADALSPDGRRALMTNETADQVSIVPVGAGDAQPLPRKGIASYAGVWWLPGGAAIVFNGRGPGAGLRAYVQALDGNPRSITPEGTWALAVSPDGTKVAVISQGQAISLVSTAGGPATSVAGSRPGDRPAGWSADGRALWVFQRGELPARVDRLDLQTGERSRWKDVLPADLAGVSSVNAFKVTPDGRAYAYSYRRILSDLFVVDGVR